MFLQKCDTLYAAISSGQWSPDHINKYEQLDTIITQSMLYAEKFCGKRYTKLYEWSPSLIKIVETVRYWRLLLKRSKGSTILILKQAAGLSADADIVEQPLIIIHLREALHAMRQAQKSHVEVRERYLTGLAEAIVLKRKPHLEGKENAESCYHLTEEQVQRLIKRERSRQMY
jgi:hypothetical protein